MPSPDPNAEAAELEQAVERTRRYSGSNRDFALLADAYLRLKPEYDALAKRVAELEDATPVDREFADLIGRQEANGTVVRLWERDGYWRIHIQTKHGFSAPVVATRSQVRQLLAALGIGSKCQ